MKNDRTLLEVDLQTLAEREVYRVPEEWVTAPGREQRLHQTGGY
ncbi:MAG: hypothetical protein ACLTXH_01305 [Enterobacter hormaechei]